MWWQVSGIEALIKAKDSPLNCDAVTVLPSVGDLNQRAVTDINSPQCQQLLKKLFNLYDSDHSGVLEEPEFLSLCRVHDPAIDPVAVRQAWLGLAQPKVYQGSRWHSLKRVAGV